MKIKDIRKVSNELFSYQWTGRTRIDKLVLELIENNSNYSSTIKEQYIDALADPTTKQYAKFILEINKKLSKI